MDCLYFGSGATIRGHVTGAFWRCGVVAHGTLMAVIETSVTAVLRERASLQPNDKAFTYIDYDQDWDGVEETLTWGQLYRRTVNMAS